MLSNPQQKSRYDPQPYQFKKIKNYIYNLQNILGRGNYSIVYKSIKQHSNQIYAVKVVELSSLTFKKLEELLDQEINIIKTLDHPNVIRCFQVLKSSNNCYMIMEMCGEGTLEKILAVKKMMTQEEIYNIAKDVFSGLKYLSQRQIIHRDIKCANIFIKQGVAKIADFGFAIERNYNFTDMNIGSPLYMSPQGYIHTQYGPKTDVWAFGIILYELAHGYVPLRHCQNQSELKGKLIKQIKKQNIIISMSEELKDLIVRCLDVNQVTRISIAQIQNCAFLNKNKIVGNQQYFYIIKNVEYVKISKSKNKISMTPCKIPKFDLNNTFTPKNTYEKNYFQKSLQLQFKKPYIHAQINLQKQNHSSTTTLNKNFSMILLNKKQNKDFINQFSKILSIIPGCISFNQSIGLIHLSRIGYKFVCILMQTNPEKIVFIAQLKSMILKILQQILQKINHKFIIYDVKQQISQKSQKLKTVTTEYHTKYQTHFQTKPQPSINLKQIQTYLIDHLRQQEYKLNDKDYYVVYLNMVLAIMVKKLKESMKNRQFNIFGLSQLIGSCFTSSNIPNNQRQYVIMKQKYQKYFQILLID